MSVEDDNSFEYTLKLPSDYPLHVIDILVKDSVGIKEEIWRRWDIIAIHSLSINYSINYS